ncbi:rhodanese-like domain-containing protein [Flavobacterium sp. ASW18X]|uniref:rhodanese-like domain-containing protein n=1 Tax=Flavobacterium sp. ASW18X TaxID=2572595 RepID=UPI0010AE7426|nr:rhodanese-like domain-containing protein [Flavobacterium sp. ASW18X]TKD66984.1 rhodanese-like domain-containing protein [Flavobacterium sp. ASW18X]
MKNILKVLCAALSFIQLGACQDNNDAVVTKVDKAFLKTHAIGKEVQLIDVRTPQEYGAGHIDDAKNINVGSADFVQQIQGLDKEQPVYLYCKMGGRSNKAAQVLKKQGFTKIYDYTGGYNDWIK